MQSFASISLSPAASDGATPFVFSLTGAILSAAVINQLKAVLLHSYWILNPSEQKTLDEASTRTGDSGETLKDTNAEDESTPGRRSRMNSLF